MPRPQVLNDVRRAELFALLSSGLTLADAARYLGCTLRTIQNAARRDAEFRRQLGNAQLSARLDPLKLMRQAAGSHWRAAAWLLERTDPDRFAARPAGACRPEQVEDAYARLIETALEEIPDPASRRRAFARLTAVAEETTRELFAAAVQPTRPAHRKSNRREHPRPLTPITSGQRLMDDLDRASQFFGEEFTGASGELRHDAPDRAKHDLPTDYFPQTSEFETEKTVAPLFLSLVQKIREKQSARRLEKERTRRVSSQKIDAPTRE